MKKALSASSRQAMPHLEGRETTLVLEKSSSNLLL